jgi:hypothetical protein
LRERGQEKRLACDAVGFGLGLRSETQLADLAGCHFVFDKRDRAWRPERDAAGRTSVEGVYIAGDGAGIAGADAAELAGERAGWAVLEEAGFRVDASRIRVLERKSAKMDRLRSVLECAFPFPDAWAENLSDNVVLCRCEEIAVADARQAAITMGVIEINRLKALTRIGMGRCQGRMCGTAAAEVLSGSCGLPVEAVGRLRAQAPVKPVPLNIVAEETVA